MASEAQILANQRNAEKSTGPRTVEGKAVASQNAVKHGLLARQDVISSEDHSEFDLHREQLLGELGPVGPVESMLAERIVSLSWRLKRAERIQNEAFDYLIAKDGFKKPWELTKSPNDPDGDADIVLGRVVVKDFARARVLERLVMYERRIEHSLYRTMAELRKLRLMRQSDPAEKPTSFEVSSFKCEGPSGTPVLQTSHLTLGTPRETPDRQLCKTNPIPVGSSLDGAPLGRGVGQAPDRPVPSSHVTDGP